MEAKHTPGPWIHDQPENMVLAPQTDGTAKLIAQARSTHYPREVRDANARLIAAAPDLLAALQTALAVIDDYLEYEHDGDPWTEDAREMGEMDIDDYRRDGRLESARAVILKATGGNHV